MLKMPRWRPIPPSRYWSNFSPPTSSLKPFSEYCTSSLSLASKSASLFECVGESLLAIFFFALLYAPVWRKGLQLQAREKKNELYDAATNILSKNEQSSLQRYHSVSRTCRAGVVAHQQRSDCVIAPTRCLGIKAVAFSGDCPTLSIMIQVIIWSLSSRCHANHRFQSFSQPGLLITP